jgi:hypothetical protein
MVLVLKGFVNGDGRLLVLLAASFKQPESYLATYVCLSACLSKAVFTWHDAELSADSTSIVVRTPMANQKRFNHVKKMAGGDRRLPWMAVYGFNRTKPGRLESRERGGKQRPGHKQSLYSLINKSQTIVMSVDEREHVLYRRLHNNNSL